MTIFEFLKQINKYIFMFSQNQDPTVTPSF
jgi:hypothetical protein